MKAERIEKSQAFIPIVVTIESQEEANYLRAVLGLSSFSLDNAGIHIKEIVIQQMWEVFNKAYINR